MDKYQWGNRILFVDENQHEIKGVIVDRSETESVLHLKIKLDAGGYYNAKLLKRPLTIEHHPVNDR